MARSLSTSLSLVLRATYENKTAGDDMSVPALALTKSISDTLSNGEGSGKAEVLYMDTLSGAGPHTVDVFGGITDAFGNTISMDQIKGLLIHNKSTTTGEYVDVFGGAGIQTVEYCSGNTDEIRVHPEGILFLWSPGAAADCPSPGAGAKDEIVITIGAGTPDIDMIIIGCE